MGEVRSKMMQGINLKIAQPASKCHDPLCPYHGNLKIRGKVRVGKVVSYKMKKAAVVEIEYFFYVPKYMRYERRRGKIHARVPPCVEIKEGSTVAIAETRPLGKNIAHVVLGEVKTGA